MWPNWRSWQNHQGRFAVIGWLVMAAGRRCVENSRVFVCGVFLVFFAFFCCLLLLSAARLNKDITYIFCRLVQFRSTRDLVLVPGSIIIIIVLFSINQLRLRLATSGPVHTAARLANHVPSFPCQSTSSGPVHTAAQLQTPAQVQFAQQLSSEWYQIIVFLPPRGSCEDRSNKYIYTI